MLRIGEHFELKPCSVQSTSMYIGTNVQLQKNYKDYSQHWNLGSNAYLKEALRIVKDIMKNYGVNVSGKGS